MNVSAVLITLNEADNIEGAVRSVAWAKEVIVVDAFSTDGTVEIARRAGAKVVQHEWTGYVAQKNFAASLAGFRWILSIDADERVSGELRDEILNLSETEKIGYRIPRRTFFLNQWIRYTSWSPDLQLRLFDRTCGYWQGGRLHESVKIDSKPGVLVNPLLHYSYRSVSDFLRRLDRYSSLAAEDGHEAGTRTRARYLLLSPAQAFFKSYVIKRGFLDGLAGLAVSGLAGVSVLFRYLKLLEMERDLQRRSARAAERAPEGAGEKIVTPQSTL